MTKAAENYDPNTLGHWLYYKVKCYECSGNEFQDLFEKIIVRVNPCFVGIKPYGKIGDKKCDGLFNSGKVVFQVYSPDHYDLSNLKSKINEDLDGAVGHWTDLEEWNFVYNTRSGLAPDIPQLLATKQGQYPSLKIGYISNDHLWEMARGLSIQQRSEILGPPIFVNQTLPLAKDSAISTDTYVVIVQDVMSPINFQTISNSLSPNKIMGGPFYLHPLDGMSWEDMAQFQVEQVEDLIKKGWKESTKFAVFSLAPIPLIIHLGFLLSNRVEAECFQFNRDKKMWEWEEDGSESGEITVSGFPNNNPHIKEVVISVSVSAEINDQDIVEVIPEPEHLIKIVVNDPNVMWVRNKKQVNDLVVAFRKVLTAIRETLPNCEKIHLFYAGPTSVAFRFGQEINPRMDAVVVTYQYNRQGKPRYQKAITIEQIK